MPLDRDSYLELAQLMREFADFLEAKAARREPAASEAKQPKPKPKKKPARKRAPAPVRPDREPSELDRARARAELRRLGYVVKP